MADISAPEITNASILFDEGDEAYNLSNNFARTGTTVEIKIDGSATEGNMWLILGVRDNINLESCIVNISMERSEEILLETTFNAIGTNASNDFIEIQSLNSSTMSLISDPLPIRDEDEGVAIEIGSLESGTYSLSYSISQQGDPWYLTGTSVEYTIKIIND